MLMINDNKSSVYSQRVLENLNSAVLLFNPDLQLSYMNPAAEMLFQVSARHMVGKEASDLICCPMGKSQSHLSHAIESGHPFTERELSLVLPDNRHVTVDCTVTPLTDRDSDAGLLVEIQKIDRQLRISKEEYLLAQNKAARELVRGLAHEIKNPLGGLRGSAQLLERELEDPSLHEYT
ncbi:MAG: PAS domain-containing protein, partial [Sedimenticolaceae bacterium]